jgi:hypothetical protein
MHESPRSCRPVGKLCASLRLVGVKQPPRAFLRSDCFSASIRITVDESTASGSRAMVHDIDKVEPYISCRDGKADDLKICDLGCQELNCFIK